MTNAPPVIANMIERTFHIRTAVNSGTAFVIECEGLQCLVTAKHVVATGFVGVGPGETIRLYGDQGQMYVASVQQIAANPEDPDGGGIDVAVLELSHQFEFDGNTPVLAGRGDIFLTQSVAMPSMEHWTAFGGQFGITTRTGTVAKVVQPGRRGPFTGDFLVEIEAYQGFSGSPIVAWDAEGNARLTGIAARMSWRTVPTFGTAPVHSGFVGCFFVQHALELARAIT